MPGPHPDRPSDAPREAARDADEQPETAPDGTAASGFPEPPGRDPGDRSDDPSPHHALNTPVGEPDPTEWPDPYDRREDPRAPAEGMTFGDSPHPQPGATSTSEPHPNHDPEAEPWEGPKRDHIDD